LPGSGHRPAAAVRSTNHGSAAGSPRKRTRPRGRIGAGPGRRGATRAVAVGTDPQECPAHRTCCPRTRPEVAGQPLEGLDGAGAAAVQAVGGPTAIFLSHLPRSPGTSRGGTIRTRTGECTDERTPERTGRPRVGRGTLLPRLPSAAGCRT